ncbi:MAG: tetratricopeptide repeat protein [Spirochaetia bacterium]
MKIVYFIVCLFCLFSCATPILRNAQKLYENGQYGQAASLYEKAIEKKEKPEYFYNLAISLMAQNKNEEALRILEKVLEIYPKNLLLLQAAILSSYEIKNFIKTKVFIEKTLKINPSNTSALIFHYYLMYEEKKPRTALMGLKQLYKQTQDPRILEPISNLSYKIGEKKQAIFWLEKSTQALPRQNTLFLLAKWQIETKQYIQATTSLTAALDYGEDNAQRFLLARLYLVHIRNKELGLENLKKSIESGYRSQADFASLLAQRTLVGRIEVRKILPKTFS